MFMIVTSHGWVILVTFFFCGFCCFKVFLCLFLFEAIVDREWCGLQSFVSIGLVALQYQIEMFQVPSLIKG
jgi:hypothetical protein